MSTAAVQAPVQEAKALLTVVESQIPLERPRSRFVDEHPFAFLGILIAISAAFAGSLIAAFAIWLYQLRYSGVLDVRF